MNDFSDIGYLIQQLISGSNEAWSFFLKQYERLIYHCINKILDNNFSQEDRDDCFQEILRVLIEDDYKRLRQIHSLNDRSFRAYIGVLSTRRTFNFRRDRNRDKKKECLVPDYILNLIPDSSKHPDKEILLARIIDIIKHKLSAQEGLVVFYSWEGLTLEEISELMDIKPCTVFNIKQRAISKLKDFLRSDKKIFE